MINLAIISDITLYREGIGKILRDMNEINVLGAYKNRHEVIKLLDGDRLDVILLDMRMPNCCEVLSLITKNYLNVKIIVIAVLENDDNYQRCIESEITGYLSKESTVEELIDAIITVDKGNLYCPKGITQYILRGIKNKRNKINDMQIAYSSALNDVTKREMQIIQLLADGMSNKQIAKTLTIEISTVKNHVHNILVKLGVESRAKVACLLRNDDSFFRVRSLYLDQQMGVH